MGRNTMCRHAVIAGVPLLALGLLWPARADDELSRSLFVGAAGVDAGDCRDQHGPCASLRYAVSRAQPGFVIRVGEGVYDMSGVDPDTWLWGPVKATGGYGDDEDFEHQDPERHRTVIIGLDTRYRAVLAARGFELDASAPSAEGSVLQQAQVAPTACVNGSAAQFPCNGIDFASQIPLASFSGAPSSASNLWGFVDQNDQREYVVIGLRNGTAVVDVTNADNPRQVGLIAGNASAWREVRILQVRDVAANRYRAYAYVTTEAANSGIQIIDLSGLPATVALGATLNDTSRQHTVYIGNVDFVHNAPLPNTTPYMIVSGSNLALGAWRAYSLSNPLAPQLIGTAPQGTQYIHDATSLIVADARTSQCAPNHSPCEVLADFNENTVDLWDVTDRANPVRLSSTSYPTASYVHSGSVSADGRYLFIHDELDEINRGLRTQIYTMDLSNLRAPSVVTSHVGDLTSTDHNGYAKGNLLYVAHYRRGLVVFDATTPNTLREIGSFDTFLTPAGNTAGTDGAWGVYPFFPSGTIAISDIDNGLFLLKDRIVAPAASAGQLALADGALSISEAAGAAAVRLRRSVGTSGAVSVRVTTRDAAATAGTDYTAVNTTVNWEAGDSAEKTVSVPILNDSTIEPDEAFTVVLSDPTGAATLGATTTLTITITNDDVAASPAPPAPAPTASGGGGGGALDLLALLGLAALGWIQTSASNRRMCAIASTEPLVGEHSRPTGPS